MRQGSKALLNDQLKPDHEPRRTAIALFDAAGRSQGALSAFLDRVRPGHAPEAIATIFDCLPGIGPEVWAEAWQQIAADLTVTLNIPSHGEYETPATLILQKFSGPDGFLALAEYVANDAAVHRRSLQHLQHETLEAVAAGWPLPKIMEFICRRAEALAPNVICSVLAVDPQMRLQSLAGPSLPNLYSGALNGTKIGPSVGACGTAAFRGEPVVVTDFANDPLWRDYRALPLPPNLQACWSSPIKGRSGAVIGTFAFYYCTPRGPNDLEREIVETCVHLCAIAIEHEEAQARIQKLAFHDLLTGLPNRPHFQKEAARVMRDLNAGSGIAAVHYIDLDDFKGVNDTFGHFAGDLLLKAVAQRFQALCGSREFVARLGGDEFAFLQYPVENEHGVADLAQRILSCFDQPFDIESRRVRIGASIGIAMTPTDGTTLDELLKRSDLALYEAKSEGICQFRFYTREMQKRIYARRQTETELRHALAKGELSVYYQPIVDLSTHDIVSFEALVRWHHPVRGMIAPGEFIHIAEESGLIGPLGDFVLAAASWEATHWPDNIKVAVNLSPTQLKNPTLVRDLSRILEESGLDPGRLELEITESVPLIADSYVRQTLSGLKTLGVGVCLDDFGTGYSSLSYLRSFPFDKIKIDLSFIRDVGRSAHASAIAQAVTGLAKNLGMTTTAEGVETELQCNWLRIEGCSEAQGYFFGRPMPSDAVRAFIAQKRTYRHLPHAAIASFA